MEGKSLRGREGGREGRGGREEREGGEGGRERQTDRQRQRKSERGRENKSENCNFLLFLCHPFAVHHRKRCMERVKMR